MARVHGQGTGQRDSKAFRVWTQFAVTEFMVRCLTSMTCTEGRSKAFRVSTQFAVSTGKKETIREVLLVTRKYSSVNSCRKTRTVPTALHCPLHDHWLLGGVG